MNNPFDIPKKWRPWRIIFTLAVVGSAAAADYRQRVMDLRARLPYVNTASWTGSMYPLIRGGEQIRCRWLPFDQVKSGMLVQFWPAWSPAPIIHRAKYWAARGRLVTQGDNCKVEDRPITEEIYLGLWEPIPGTSRPAPADFKHWAGGLYVAPVYSK